MKLKCVKCENVKELNKDELEEVGRFVQDRKLKAVHFLKYLSMDMREDNICTDGRNHEWEYEDGFDKEVHLISKNINDTGKVIDNTEKENIELDSQISELTKKKEANLGLIESKKFELVKGIDKLKEIAWIGDPGLWS